MYDAYGRLVQKGGSTYTYGTNHLHAATSAHGWTYNYNDNGDVVSKTDGVDTYTFTYTRELKIATISLNAQVLHRFGYDANGNRVAERRSNGMLVFSVGGYYEYNQNGAETHTTLFYGSEALRVDGELRFILTDHLGSTSIITDEIGEYLAEQRYDAWGSTRYVDGVIPTDKQYTSQRISEDIGLYDYKARWYDPLLGRFLMEDTIIPNQGVMRLDRYAAMLNNPVRYTDPTGHMVPCEQGTVCRHIPKYNHSPTPVAPRSLDDNGLAGYNTYLRLYYDTSGWWWTNDLLGGDGEFSLEDFLVLIIFKELSNGYDLPDVNGVSYFESFKEALTRSFYSWSKEMKRLGIDSTGIIIDPNRIEAKLNFLIGYSGKNTRTKPENFDVKQSQDPSVAIPKAKEVYMVFNNPPSDWTNGCVNGRPCAIGSNHKDLHLPYIESYVAAGCPGYYHYPPDVCDVDAGFAFILDKETAILCSAYNCPNKDR